MARSASSGSIMPGLCAQAATHFGHVQDFPVDWNLSMLPLQVALHEGPRQGKFAGNTGRIRPAPNRSVNHLLLFGGKFASEKSRLQFVLGLGARYQTLA